MIQTKRAIIDLIASGHIVAPLDLVQENSVNVRLGADMWQCASDDHAINLHAWRRFKKVRTSYDTLWCNHRQQYATMYGFWLPPKSFCVGSTDDAYGVRLLDHGPTILPEMKARSTTGRHGLTVSMCAGWGDVGYNGRWALEIFNMNDKAVFIAIGTEIGQCVFHEGTPAQLEDAYGGDGRYMLGDGTIRFLPKPFEIPERYFK